MDKEALRTAIAARLEALMHARGFTRYRLDKTAGLNDVTRSILEGRSASPTVVTLATLAHALGVSLADMLDSPEDGRSQDVAHRLARIREAMGISLESFAAAGGDSPEIYALREEGLLRLPITQAIQFGTAFGVPLDYLYHGRLEQLTAPVRAALQSRA